MAKSLYGVIKQVENAYDLVSKYTVIDKKAGLRRVFEEWKSNQLVEAVMEGRTTFYEEHRKVFDEYDFKNILMTSSLPEGFKEKVADLEACIGTSGMTESYISMPSNLLDGSLRIGSVGLGVSLLSGLLEHKFGFGAGGLNFQITKIKKSRDQSINANRSVLNTR